VLLVARRADIWGAAPGASAVFAMSIPATDAPAAASPAARVLALYPVHVRLRDGSEITIRALGPQDAEREQAFVRALSPETRYFRFMNTLRELPAETLYRFTHPDFEREIALVALAGEGTELRQVGVARCVAQDPPGSAEFAVVIADEWHSRGVGTRLMCELMRAARAGGLRSIWGDVLSSNHRMLALMSGLGFEILHVPEDPLVRRVVKKIVPSEGLADART